MSPAQSRAYKAYFSSCSWPEGMEIPPPGASGDVSYIIEIGFGMGDATWQIAAAHPENQYIGIEVHKPGIGKLLDHIHKEGLTNLKILEGDAVQILETRVQKESIKGFHIFFPDPWPKKKHHKRRLIQKEFLDILVSRLSPGGYVYAVTDWEDYALGMLELFEAHALLKNRSSRFCEPREWRPVTKFEGKGLAKSHAIYELLFDKI